MEIALVGVAVSFLVQWLKVKFGPENEWRSLAVLAVSCLVVAVLYTALREYGYWEAVVGILMTASTFYAIVLARFHSEK